MRRKKQFPSLSGELRTFLIDINNYSKIKKIGAGGFADVWKARDRTTGNYVALKEFTTNVDDEIINVFMREIRTMANIEHPFILKLIGFTPGPPLAMISEYIHNSSLYQYRSSEKNRENLTPTRRTIIAMGLAHAMMTLHKINIIHRDLKSMNILLDDDLLPKLCDFGLARYMDSGEPMSRARGTPNWMAPEVADDKNYGPACDVYSYAMILYELITDDIPWRGLDTLAVLKKVGVERARPKLHKCDPALKQLVTMCWADDPKQRPSFKEIYRMFAKSKVAFPGTHKSAIDKLAKKLSKFEENQTWSRTQFPDSKNLSIRYSSNSTSKGNSHYKSALSKSKENSTYHSTNKRSYKSSQNYSLSRYESQQSDSQFVDLEAISDPRSFQFKPELQRAAKNLPQVQSRPFMSAIASFLKEDTEPGVIEAVLNSLSRVLQRKFHRQNFLESGLLKHIPIGTDRSLDAALDVFFVIFDTDPKSIDGSFKDIMKDIIERRPEKALTLLAMYSKAFEQLPDAWPLLDLLLERASTFIKAGCGAGLVSTIFFLCYNFDEYSDARLKQSLHVFKRCLESRDAKVVAASYNAICHFYSSKISLDYGLVTEHLGDPKIAPCAVGLLLRASDVPAVPELVRALLKCAEQSSEASLALVKIAALEEGSKYLLRKSSWLSKKIPTTADTFRLFLAVLTHVELRPIIARTHAVCDLIKAACADNLLLAVAIALRRMEATKRTVADLSESGALAVFVQAAADDDDDKTEAAVILALFEIGHVTFAPEYLGYAERLKSIIINSGPNCQNAIALIALLSRYPLCAKKFIELRLHKLYKKLLNDPDYREYAEEFMDNYERFNEY